MNTHYIKKCIELARKGEGCTAPNPMVGAVLVNNFGEEISSGYHQKYGEGHAEVNCLKGVCAEDATLYVNLEPCSHHGKTPPCVDLIIQKRVKRVVIGILDPNPKVSGKGVKKLQEAGIDVTVGVLESECRDLNKVFIKNITTEKPFVAIKTATTLDGKIATFTGSSKWITSNAARKEVHRLRAKYDAIFTGSETVLADNPSLTARVESSQGKNPVRIIMDTKNKTPKNAKVYDNNGTKVIKITEFEGFDKLFKEFYKEGIYSILVEAGPGLNSAIIKAQEADWLYQFIAPKILGSGKSFVEGFDIAEISECIKLELRETIDFSPDCLLSLKFIYYN